MDGRRTGALRKQLAAWFLAIGLVPWLIVAVISYYQTRASLSHAAENDLAHTAVEKVRFINNWFKYRWMDLNLQARDQANMALLLKLKQALHDSGLGSRQFVDSPEWEQLVESRHHDLNNVLSNYDYIYDLFLIDTDGNVLFTVARESDLGTNLFTGPLQNSRFARAVARTLDLRQPSFSDHEEYAPSDNLISSFLVAPIIDENNQLRGVFACQIRLDLINRALAYDQSDDVYHYLVGNDGLLRSPIQKQDDVLHRKINNPAFSAWQLATQSNAAAAAHPITYHYESALGVQVLGQYNPISIGNIRWGLISEIDEQRAYAFSNWMAKFDIILLLLSTLSIFAAAFFFSKRLSQPIAHLNNAVEAFARNETIPPLELHRQNEIETLADNFNKMMAARERYEGQLRVS